jgi:two-component system OmpR family sensor kinase
VPKHPDLDPGAAGVAPATLLAWSHDVRNPMSALLANVHHVRDVAGAAHPEVAEVLGECAALCGVIERYLQNLELVAGGGPRPRAAVKLGAHEVVDEVVRRLGGYAAATGHSLVVEPASGDVAIQAEPTMLRIALENLVAHSIESSPGGAVTLSMRVSAGDLAIVVADRGPAWSIEEGIVTTPPRERGRVGTRIGKGLGLQVAALAAAAAGARIAIETLAEGSAPSPTLRAPLAVERP